MKKKKIFEELQIELENLQAKWNEKVKCKFRIQFNENIAKAENIQQIYLPVNETIAKKKPNNSKLKEENRPTEIFI